MALAPEIYLWRDKGGNVGIQCASCLRTHWTSAMSVVDPKTGQPCNNCVNIKNEGLLASEQASHNNERPGVDDCLHKPTQP